VVTVGTFLPRDAIQGATATCGPVATMRALAGVGFDFAPLIERPAAGGFLVRLWHPWKGVRAEITVGWDGTVTPKDLPIPRSKRPWAVILHRALVKMRPSVLTTGLALDGCLYLFTGQQVRPLPAKGSYNAVKKAVAERRAVTASTWGEVTPGAGVEPAHAYRVYAVTEAGGFGLESPWGTTVTLSGAHFARNFSDVVIQP
jgi:hypothetical protein